MIRANVSKKEALALFLCKKFKEGKCMCKVIDDFKISLIEDGKSPKTIESYIGDIRGFIEFLGSKGVEFNGMLQRFYVVSYDNYLNTWGESRDFIIQSIVRDIAFKSEESKKVETEMRKLLKLLDLKLETIPGIDTVTAIALVAHIGDIKRFRNADKLAKFSGIAPVNFSSAGKGKDKKSKQGNRELYGVFYFLAVQQIQVSKKGTPRNPVFLEYYKRKVSEGKTKIQALVCVMRRLNNIIYGMMKNKTEYILPDMEVEQIA